MEKIIQSLINNWTKGVNTYTHNGSTWLIFTDSKKWVIELTDNKTLWYNYNFFKQIFEFTSLDVVQNQHLITKWVEDNIMNETKRTNGRGKVFNRRKVVESVIKNGVKETNGTLRRTLLGVDDIIQNGVKETKVEKRPGIKDTKIEDTIENGVEETNWANHADPERIDEIIEKGVKRTMWANYADPSQIDEAIEGSIKETNYDTSQYIEDVNEVIENGIEEIYEVDWDVPNDVIDDVVDNGVKNSNPRQYVGESLIDRIIDKGIIETHDDIYHHRGRVDGVIKNGIKETEPQDDWVNTVRIVTEVIDEGIKKPTD